ncbi:MAG: hypothetical protein V9E93_15080 [Steroidobacteraceae bacterium]
MNPPSASERRPEPAHREAMPLSFGQFSALIGAIYQGPLETVPWGSALVMLREIMRANWATLILRPASADQSALVIRASERGHEVYNAAYSHFQTFSMDPFVGLPVQCVVTIDEMIDSSWMTGDFYKAFLEPNDIRYIMGADIVTEDGADCRLRITRPLGGQNFSGEGEGAVPGIAAAPEARRDPAFADRPHRDRASVVLDDDRSDAARHGRLRRKWLGHAD